MLTTRFLFALIRISIDQDCDEGHGDDYDDDDDDVDGDDGDDEAGYDDVPGRRSLP